MSTNTNNVKLAGNLVNFSNKQQQQYPAQVQTHQTTKQSQLNQQLKSQTNQLLPNPLVKTSSLGSVPQQVSQLHPTSPPRYQPPPHPQGGILKHLTSPKSRLSNHYPSDVTNIKYPPEIPKLTPVFIPDSSKNSQSGSRGIPVRTTTQLRHSTGTTSTNHSANQQHHRLIEDDQQFSRLPLSVNSGVHQTQEMLKFVRKADTESNASAPSANGPSINGRLSADHNRQLQSLYAELRTLKEANQKLSDDNQELRDLCCFLDDDRQKGRKLAREWQRFGRYTASVMRQEVSAYQTKLRQLDDKQQELIRDNLELKELCLYLDEERTNIPVASSVTCTNCGAVVRTSMRDDGDGSSSSTNADEPMPSVRQFGTTESEAAANQTLHDQTLQYVRSLEMRIKQLEDERNAQSTNGQIPDPLSGRPEAVVRALQVLEVREQLERDRNCNLSSQSDQMDSGEKALVREMCNVVWRKLEENPSVPGPSRDQQ